MDGIRDTMETKTIGLTKTSKVIKDQDDQCQGDWWRYP